MSDIPLTRLDGEVDPNDWHFSSLGEMGPLPNPVGHTFPLLTHTVDGRWQLVGTGFYVNDSGLFVTARHVIEHVLQDSKQALPLIILHLRSESGLFGPSEFHFRPIMQCWLSDSADVAFGAAATAINNFTGEVMKNWTWTLSWSVPANGSPVATYAFPNHTASANGHRIHFSPQLYEGGVQDSGDFQDRVVVPYPYLQVDFRIHPAASGGPIVSGGRVIGINYREWVNIDHPPGPGIGAQSRCLAEAFLEDIVLLNETIPRLVIFDELVRSGCINVESYTPRAPNEPLRGKTVRLDMPATAPRPRIEI